MTHQTEHTHTHTQQLAIQMNTLLIPDTSISYSTTLCSLTIHTNIMKKPAASNFRIEHISSTL
jgi:hypothetical protein